MPLVMGGPWQGGYFGSASVAIAVTAAIADGTGRWLGENLASEFGSIATNDDHANTVYEYKRLHAPTIPSVASGLSEIPQPTTGAALPSVNGVNPNAADEYFLFTWDSTLSNWANNSAYRVIFIAKSINTDGNGGDISVGGTEAVPRWFVFFDPDDHSAVQTFRPWDVTEPNRANIRTLDHINADFIYMVGLDFTPNIMGRQRGCDNITYYRCMSGGYSIHCVGPAGGGTSSRSDNFTMFECFSNATAPSAADVGFMAMIRPGKGARIISCAARDLVGDFVQWDENGEPDDCIVEDCDYWRELFTNNDGVEVADDTLLYCRGEGFVDIKSTANPLTSQWAVQVLGCRVWLMRVQDSTLSPGGTGTGIPVNMSINTTRKEKINVQYNVFHDIVGAGVSFFAGAHLGGASGGNNISENLLSFFHGGSVGGGVECFFIPSDDTTLKNNTTVNTSGAAANCAFFRRAPVTIPNFLGQNNCFIDATASPDGFSSTGNLDGPSVFHHSAFVGTGEQFEKPSGSTNYTNASVPSMNFGDFTYTRKKLIAPENHTITGCVPTTSTPNAFLTGAI